MKGYQGAITTKQQRENPIARQQLLNLIQPYTQQCEYNLNSKQSSEVDLHNHKAYKEFK